eukprot:scaffold105972_cov19-Tisochrysis_lutea.AAC.1
MLLAAKTKQQKLHTSWAIHFIGNKLLYLGSKATAHLLRCYLGLRSQQAGNEVTTSWNRQRVRFFRQVRAHSSGEATIKVQVRESKAIAMQTMQY